MKIKYHTRYKERLFAFVTEFYNFFWKMNRFESLVTRQMYLYLTHHPDFDPQVLQNYFNHNQGDTRRFRVSLDLKDFSLFFSAELWHTTTAAQIGPANYCASLHVRNYMVTLESNDEMAYKLSTEILSKIAFINGPAYKDKITVDSEEFPMGFFIAASFYKLCGDEVGYFSTLDEARDRL